MDAVCLFQAMEAFKMMKEQGVVVTAEEIKSMLFILSQSKDHDRGTKWKESLELVKEAEERGIIMPLKVYNGGERAKSKHTNAGCS